MFGADAYERHAGVLHVLLRAYHDPRVYETTIKEVFSKDGKITGVKTVEVEFQTIDGKRQLVERKGTEKELPCDLLLVAAGFVGAEEYTAKVKNNPHYPGLA